MKIKNIYLATNTVYVNLIHLTGECKTVFFFLVINAIRIIIIYSTYQKLDHRFLNTSF